METKLDVLARLEETEEPAGRVVDIVSVIVSEIVPVAESIVVEVVETIKVDGRTWVESAGQSVIVGAQLVTVKTLVVWTVDAVHGGAVLGPGLRLSDDAVDGRIRLVGRLEELLDWVRSEAWLTNDVVLLDVESVVTGYMVLEMAMVEVSKLVESAGQSVTVAAQLVTVTMRVV